MIKVRLAFLILMILSIFQVSPLIQGSAQSDIFELTKMVGETGGFPKITSDAYGNLYVAWESWKNDETSKSIYFSKFVDHQWQQPVELVYSNQDVLLGDIFVTSNGRINILWATGNEISITHCEKADTHNIHNWEKTLVASSDGSIAYPSFPHLAVSEKQQLWVVSWALPKGVYINVSKDGDTWQPDQLIWAAPNNKSAPSNGLILITDDNVLLTWSEHTEINSWMGQAIWLATINTQDLNSFQIREVIRTSLPEGPTVDWPSIFRGPNKTLFLFWDNGVGSRTGRYYQISTDMGQTWGPIKNIFSGKDGLSGQAGPVQVVIDSNDQVYFFSAAFGPDGIAAIRYFSEVNGVWSDYLTIKNDQLSDDYEIPSVTITGGNTIHVVWHDIIGRVFYKSILTSAPAIPLPTPPVKAEATLINTADPSEVNTQTAVKTVQPVSTFTEYPGNPTANSMETPMFPLIASGLAVMILISVVVLFYFKKKG